MKGIVYLAWRYLVHHRVKTAILVGAIGLVIYLPFAVQLLVEDSSRQLSARAEQTPMVVGAAGSELELALKALYFHGEAPTPLDYLQLKQLQSSGRGLVLPVYARFMTQGAPIVGTDIAYFDARHLSLASGRLFAMLGEVVLGHRVARRLGMELGDTMASSPENVFDIAGVYPLKMRVVGVLAASNSVDDEAVFVDLKTSWVIEGLGHGHQDLAEESAARQVLQRDEERIVANASVLEYNVITSENVTSFHFHGSDRMLPLTGLLVFPNNHKDQAMLLGDFQSGAYEGQAIQPRLVIEQLLETVFSIKQYVLLAMGIVIIATATLAALIFLLSARLRKKEIDTLLRIGGSRATVIAMLGCEVLMVLVLAVVLALFLLSLTQYWGPGLMQALVLG